MGRGGVSGNADTMSRLTDALDVAQLSARPALGTRNAGAVRHLHQADLARRWNISPRTLERWRWLRLGPAYIKIGGRVVYRLEDILTYETQQLRGGR